MFKHILVPTDGSRLATRGVKTGIRLARALGARATAIFVIPPYVAVYGEAALYAPAGGSKAYQAASERAAKKALAAAQIEAQTAGVACVTLFITDPQPWGGILRVARSKKCDAIVMASHGRGALGGLLLGSETQRVLSHSKLPVLVAR